MATGVLSQQGGMPDAPPPGGGGVPTDGRVDPRMMELFMLVVARVRQALAKVGPELHAALKADPVAAAVQFGTRALREVVKAAQQAGKALPVEVIFAAGMQTTKDIAAIALENGFLDESGIDGFMKEVFQQSFKAYVQMDADEGDLSPQDARAVQDKFMQASAPQPGPAFQGAPQ